MSNKHSLQMLTGTSAEIYAATGDEAKLWKGQPIYNLDKMYLTIGTEDNSNNSKITALPIKVRELVGYPADDTAITSETSNPYSIKYDSTEGLQLNASASVNKITFNAANSIIPNNKTLKIGASAGIDIKFNSSSNVASIYPSAGVVTDSNLKLEIFSGKGQSVRVGAPDYPLKIYKNGTATGLFASSLSLRTNEGDDTKSTLDMSQTYMRLFKGYNPSTPLYITSRDSVEITAYGSQSGASYSGNIYLNGTVPNLTVTNLTANGKSLNSVPEHLYAHILKFTTALDSSLGRGGLSIMYIDNNSTYTSGSGAYLNGWVVGGKSTFGDVIWGCCYYSVSTYVWKMYVIDSDGSGGLYSVEDSFLEGFTNTPGTDIINLQIY